MRVLVTRPAEQARDWTARLRAQGIDAAALPLIAIDDVADPVPLRAAWAALAERQLVIFVSPNAVARFFAQRPAGLAWPPGLRAGSPGPGTSAALRAAGVLDGEIIEPDAGPGRYDSEALWAALQTARPWAGASVLIVRGSTGGEPQGNGREWLADTLRAAGAQVDLVAAYRRVAPRFDDAERAQWQQALAAPAQHLWLFSSSEAIEQLEALRPPGPPPWGPARALATHPRIAERARDAGFGTVLLAPPTLAAVIDAIRASDTAR